MFTAKDYEKLQAIMNEDEEKRELLSRLLDSHRMTVSMISHEIRNPLTLVYSTLQLIESRYPEVHTFKYWADFHKDIDYMRLLLEELSSYNNGDRLHLSLIDTNTFFKSIALSFASSLITADIQFISKIDTGLPSIYGDTVKLREVILNLLGNARDAVTTNSSHDNAHPAIWFKVSCSSNSLLITIEDNGCGISKEQLDTIFEPFTTYKKNGTGLGLPIALKIIKAHHGTIEVSSLPGIRTTFLLSLPVQQDC